MATERQTGHTSNLDGLVGMLGTDRQAVATPGAFLPCPFDTLVYRSYDLGRAAGIHLVAERQSQGPISLSDLWEILREHRDVYRTGENEREARLVRSYVKGLWQGVCLFFLEVEDDVTYQSLQETTERLRLARGDRVEAEIDIEATRVRDEWWGAETDRHLERLIHHSARLATLVDIANQKARDRFILSVADLVASGRTPPAALEAARVRLIERAASEQNADMHSFLRRQAFAFLSDDQARELLPQRPRRS